MTLWGIQSVATASTGVAALLLDGGTTAHSAYKIPIEVDRTMPSQMLYEQAERLRNAKVHIVDEVTMLHKDAFDHIDKTLREAHPLHDEKRAIPFADQTIIISGDFKQLLPVVTENPQRPKYTFGCFALQ